MERLQSCDEPCEDTCTQVFNVNDRCSTRSGASAEAQLSSKISSIQCAALVIIWIAFSITLVLSNKFILTNLDFPFPATLTCWHILFATIITQALAQTSWLLEERQQVYLSPRRYLGTILPIGILFSGSLICNNMAYLTLSVAFIQMLKGLGPATVLLATCSLGLERPDWTKCITVLVIIGGVILASVGELTFALDGFVLQLMGLLFSAYRLGLTKKLLQFEGRKMHPLVALSYLAPISAIMLIAAAWMLEWRGQERSRWADVNRVGWIVLLANAAAAFGLNVARIQMIGLTGPLAIPLCGEARNMVIVIASIAFWDTHITPLQVIGYLTITTGLLYYAIRPAYWRASLDLVSDKLRSIIGYKKVALDAEIN